MNLRPARPEDVPAIDAVMTSVGEPMEWPGLPGWPYLEHLVSRARVAVAEIDDTIVGFGGSIGVRSDDVRFVTDLYVEPSWHGRGVGQALLADILSGTREALTFSSGNPNALPVYVRQGMRPWWPVLYLAGTLGQVLPERIEAVASSIEETARLSMLWSGVDRTADFRHYAELPDAAGYVILDEGGAAAVCWAARDPEDPGRFVYHATIGPDADPTRAALAIWAAASAGGRLLAGVPGPHPALATLLEAGARIEDRDTFCATDPGLLDPARILPNPGLL